VPDRDGVAARWRWHVDPEQAHHDADARIAKVES
jgi:hypothetical protein